MRIDRCLRLAPHALQVGALAAAALLVANVQVATRLLCAACPAFHWHLARLLLPHFFKVAPGVAAKKNEPREEREGRRAPELPAPGWMVVLLLLLWFGSYNVLGTLLHANALPWT